MIIWMKEENGGQIEVKSIYSHFIIHLFLFWQSIYFMFPLFGKALDKNNIVVSIDLRGNIYTHRQPCYKHADISKFFITLFVIYIIILLYGW